jgi:hypothetical protein
MAAAVVATLTIGMGMSAVVYTVIHKILIEPMPYRDPDDLYFVWGDLRAYTDLSRGWLGGPDVAELQKAGGVIEDASGGQKSVCRINTRAANGRGLLGPIGSSSYGTGTSRTTQPGTGAMRP